MADQVDNMSDAELLAKLAEHGLSVIPITDALTRELLVKRLKLAIETTRQSQLSVAITTVPRSKLTEMEAKIIHEKITHEIFYAHSRASEPGKTTKQAPAFVGRSFLVEGKLKLCCQDLQTLSWLHEVIPRMQSPRPGTRLAVTQQAAVLVRVMSALYVPDFMGDIGKLQHVLSQQNPFYNISSWTLYNFKTTNHISHGYGYGVFLVLGIPREQLGNILARKRMVAYSTKSIYIWFFDGSDLSAVPPKEDSTTLEDTEVVPNGKSVSPWEGTIETDDKILADQNFTKLLKKCSLNAS